MTTGISPKTIQIYLPHGEPRGIRIAEITTRIVQAVQVPRTLLDSASKRPESEQVALYFLFGDAEDRVKPLVYIGQSESPRTRLKQHNVEKDFWTTAVLVVSRTQSFTQAHIRWLEWWSISQAKEAGRFAIENGNAGAQPYVPEPMKADLYDAFDTSSTLLATLGYPLFEPVASSLRSGSPVREIYYAKGPDADGRGEIVEDGFVVLSGSLCRSSLAPSAEEKYRDHQARLIAGGVLVPQSKTQLAFTQDFLFQSPSTAAGIVLGRSANGWTTWKTAEGRTLHDAKRAAGC